MDSEEIKKETSESIQLPTYKIMIDNVPVKEKPENAGIIINRLNVIKEITIPQLFKYLSLGYTVRPGILINGATENDFKQQEFIFIDVDNDKKKDTITTLDETLSIFKKYNLNPIGYYYSFSHTKEYPRYRIVFRIEKPITESIKIKLLLSSITSLIPNADTSCTTVAKIFYGTNKGYEILDANAVITLEQVEDLIATTVAATSKDNDKKNSFNKDLNQQIKDFDFYSYLCNETKVLRKGSNYIAFDVCPICGHNDCLRYYPKSNSFYCFGSSGNVGGSIIEYLMATKKMDKKEAINYFKYEILKLSREKEKKSPSYKSLDELKKNCNKEVRESVLTLRVYNLEIELPNELYWIDYEFSSPKGRFVPVVCCPMLAEFLKKKLHYLIIKTIANHNNPKCLYYGGYYHILSNTEFKNFIEPFFPIECRKDAAYNEILKLMSIDTRYYVDEEKLDSDMNIINFKNGIYHIDTDELTEHSPKYLTTYQIENDYNKNIEKPKNSVFENFMDTFSNNDVNIKDVLLNYMALSLSNIPGYLTRSALFIIGPGGTGKTQYKTLIQELIGNKNCSNLDLNDLENHFNCMDLLRKRLAGSNDISGIKLKNLAKFKMLTGGDKITGAYKYMDVTNFKFTGVLIFCGNLMPVWGCDKGEHVYERMVFIEPKNIIPKEKRNKLIVQDMLKEKDYIISILVEKIKLIVKNNYEINIPDSCLKLREQYKLENNSVQMFLKECTEIIIREPDPSDPTTGQFYTIYKNYCQDNNNGYYENPREFRKIVLEETKLSKEKGIKKTYGGNTYYKNIIPTDEAKTTYGVEKGVFKKQM